MSGGQATEPVTATPPAPQPGTSAPLEDPHVRIERLAPYMEQGSGYRRGVAEGVKYAEAKMQAGDDPDMDLTEAEYSAGLRPRDDLGRVRRGEPVETVAQYLASGSVDQVEPATDSGAPGPDPEPVSADSGTSADAPAAPTPPEHPTDPAVEAGYRMLVERGVPADAIERKFHDARYQPRRRSVRAAWRAAVQELAKDIEGRTEEQIFSRYPTRPIIPLSELVTDASRPEGQRRNPWDYVRFAVYRDHLRIGPAVFTELSTNDLRAVLADLESMGAGDHIDRVHLALATATAPNSFSHLTQLAAAADQLPPVDYVSAGITSDFGTDDGRAILHELVRRVENGLLPQARLVKQLLVHADADSPLHRDDRLVMAAVTDRIARSAKLPDGPASPEDVHARLRRLKAVTEPGEFLNDNVAQLCTDAQQALAQGNDPHLLLVKAEITAGLRDEWDLTAARARRPLRPVAEPAPFTMANELRALVAHLPDRPDSVAAVLDTARVLADMLDPDVLGTDERAIPTRAGFLDVLVALASADFEEVWPPAAPAGPPGGHQVALYARDVLMAAARESTTAIRTLLATAGGEDAAHLRDALAVLGAEPEEQTPDSDAAPAPESEEAAAALSEKDVTTPAAPVGELEPADGPATVDNSTAPATTGTPGTSREQHPGSEATPSDGVDHAAVTAPGVGQSPDTSADAPREQVMVGGYIVYKSADGSYRVRENSGEFRIVKKKFKTMKTAVARAEALSKPTEAEIPAASSDASAATPHDTAPATTAPAVGQQPEAGAAGTAGTKATTPPPARRNRTTTAPDSVAAQLMPVVRPRPPEDDIRWHRELVLRGVPLEAINARFDAALAADTSHDAEQAWAVALDDLVGQVRGLTTEQIQDRFPAEPSVPLEALAADAARPEHRRVIRWSYLRYAGYQDHLRAHGPDAFAALGAKLGGAVLADLALMPATDQDVDRMYATIAAAISGENYDLLPELAAVAPEQPPSEYVRAAADSGFCTAKTRKALNRLVNGPGPGDDSMKKPVPEARILLFLRKHAANAGRADTFLLRSTARRILDVARLPEDEPASPEDVASRIGRLQLLAATDGAGSTAISKALDAAGAEQKAERDPHEALLRAEIAAKLRDPQDLAAADAGRPVIPVREPAVLAAARSLRSHAAGLAAGTATRSGCVETLDRARELVELLADAGAGRDLPTAETLREAVTAWGQAGLSPCPPRGPWRGSGRAGDLVATFARDTTLGALRAVHETVRRMVPSAPPSAAPHLHTLLDLLGKAAGRQPDSGTRPAPVSAEPASSPGPDTGPADGAEPSVPAQAAEQPQPDAAGEAGASPQARRTSGPGPVAEDPVPAGPPADDAETTAMQLLAKGGIDFTDLGADGADTPATPTAPAAGESPSPTAQPATKPLAVRELIAGARELLDSDTVQDPALIAGAVLLAALRTSRALRQDPASSDRAATMHTRVEQCLRRLFDNADLAEHLRGYGLKLSDEAPAHWANEGQFLGPDPAGLCDQVADLVSGAGRLLQTWHDDSSDPHLRDGLRSAITALTGPAQPDADPDALQASLVNAAAQLDQWTTTSDPTGATAVDVLSAAARAAVALYDDTEVGAGAGLTVDWLQNAARNLRAAGVPDAESLGATIRTYLDQVPRESISGPPAWPMYERVADLVGGVHDKLQAVAGARGAAHETSAALLRAAGNLRSVESTRRRVHAQRFSQPAPPPADPAAKTTAAVPAGQGSREEGTPTLAPAATRPPVAGTTSQTGEQTGPPPGEAAPTPAPAVPAPVRPEHSTERTTPVPDTDTDTSTTTPTRPASQTDGAEGLTRAWRAAEARFTPSSPDPAGPVVEVLLLAARAAGKAHRLVGEAADKTITSIAGSINTLRQVSPFAKSVPQDALKNVQGESGPGISEAEAREMFKMAGQMMGAAQGMLGKLAEPLEPGEVKIAVERARRDLEADFKALFAASSGPPVASDSSMPEWPPPPPPDQSPPGRPAARSAPSAAAGPADSNWFQAQATTDAPTLIAHLKNVTDTIDATQTRELGRALAAAYVATDALNGVGHAGAARTAAKHLPKVEQLLVRAGLLRPSDPRQTVTVTGISPESDQYTGIINNRLEKLLTTVGAVLVKTAKEGEGLTDEQRSDVDAAAKGLQQVVAFTDGGLPVRSPAGRAARMQAAAQENPPAPVPQSAGPAPQPTTPTAAAGSQRGEQPGPAPASPATQAASPEPRRGEEPDTAPRAASPAVPATTPAAAPGPQTQDTKPAISPPSLPPLQEAVIASLNALRGTGERPVPRAEAATLALETAARAALAASTDTKFAEGVSPDKDGHQLAVRIETALEHLAAEEVPGAEAALGNTRQLFTNRALEPPRPATQDAAWAFGQAGQLVADAADALAEVEAQLQPAPTASAAAQPWLDQIAATGTATGLAGARIRIGMALNGTRAAADLNSPHTEEARWIIGRLTDADTALGNAGAPTVVVPPMPTTALDAGDADAILDAARYNAATTADILDATAPQAGTLAQRVWTETAADQLRLAADPTASPLIPRLKEAEQDLEATAGADVPAEQKAAATRRALVTAHRAYSAVGNDLDGEVGASVAVDRETVRDAAVLVDPAVEPLLHGMDPTAGQDYQQVYEQAGWLAETASCRADQIAAQPAPTPAPVAEPAVVVDEERMRRSAGIAAAVHLLDHIVPAGEGDSPTGAERAALLRRLRDEAGKHRPPAGADEQSLQKHAVGVAGKVAPELGRRQKAWLAGVLRRHPEMYSVAPPTAGQQESRARHVSTALTGLADRMEQHAEVLVEASRFREALRAVDRAQVADPGRQQHWEQLREQIRAQRAEPPAGEGQNIPPPAGRGSRAGHRPPRRPRRSSPGNWPMRGSSSARTRPPVRVPGQDPQGSDRTLTRFLKTDSDPPYGHEELTVALDNLQQAAPKGPAQRQ